MRGRESRHSEREEWNTLLGQGLFEESGEVVVLDDSSEYNESSDCGDEDEEEGEALGPGLPCLARCRKVSCFKRLNHIDDGTFGQVHRAVDRATGAAACPPSARMSCSR